MAKQKLPTAPGQITAIWVSESHVPKDQYIVCSKPVISMNGGMVKVCAISELKMATFERREPNCEYIPLYNLYVIAEDLKSYAEILSNELPALFQSLP